MGVVSMFRKQSLLSVRFAGVALALFTASLVSFPSFPTTGAGSTSSPAISVNRPLKGDRLPFAKPTVRPRELGLPVSPVRPHAQIPVGCDSAFSPISSSRLVHVFRRCMV